VHHEKRHCHLAAGNESGNARQQAESDEKSANDFDPAACHHQWGERFGFASKGAEYFIEAVTGEHQPDDQTHDAIKRIRKAIERVHNRQRLMMSILQVKTAL
jgi:hypothetical protein